LEIFKAQYGQPNDARFFVNFTSLDFNPVASLQLNREAIDILPFLRASLPLQDAPNQSQCAMPMECQWNANGMPMECQWNANGMPMECQWNAMPWNAMPCHAMPCACHAHAMRMPDAFC
jgi:hypothetical protein